MRRILDRWMCGKDKKMNNKGAALIMVIVVISFVSITATILLYMSAMNFYMKATDKKTKDSFYSGEAAMEQIRATLMAYASDSAKEAYAAVLVNYAVTDPTDLQKEFNTEFVSRFKSKWAPASVTITDADSVKNYLISVVGSGFSGSISMDTPSGTSPTSIDDIMGTFKLKDVRLTYTDSSGYTTIITTDFVVQAPPINFSMNASAEAAKSGEVIDLVDYVTYNNYTKR